MKVGSTQPCGFCVYKPLANVILCNYLRILGTHLASIHCPGQNLIKCVSNMASLRRPCVPSSAASAWKQRLFLGSCKNRKKRSQETACGVSCLKDREELIKSSNPCVLKQRWVQRKKCPGRNWFGVLVISWQCKWASAHLFIILGERKEETKKTSVTVVCCTLVLEKRSR